MHTKNLKLWTLTHDRAFMKYKSKFNSKLKLVSVTTLATLSLLFVSGFLTTDAHAFGQGRSTGSKATATPAPPIVTTNPTTPVATATATPMATATPATAPTGAVAGATSCLSTDPNHICIGLKLVAYTKSGVATLSEAQAITLVTGMNKVWSQCNIGFQLEKYSAVDPATYGLNYSPDWENDGDTIRSKFEDNSTFLVVAVGPWTDATIAVTEMPGAGVYGTLVDAQYATNPLTVGHELGHYQGLYHVSDSTNLMNPYIGPNTATLTSSQCTTSRNTDFSYWQNMMRN
jgi:hypothetical protein